MIDIPNEKEIVDIGEMSSSTANSSVSKPVVSHAVLLTTAQLSRGVLRLLFVVVVARALGPTQFGLYVLLLAIIEMIAVVSGAGYTDYLTRETAKDACLGWGLASQLVWLRLTYTIPSVLVVLGVVALLRYPRAMMITVAWMSLTLVFRSLSEAVQGVLRGVGRYVEFLTVDLAFGLTLVTGASFFLVRKGGINTAVGVEIAATAMAAIASVILTLKFRTKKRFQVTVSTLIKTSAIFNVYAFVVNLYDRLDVLLLSTLAGNYATGVYGAAYRPIGTLQLLPYGVLYSLLPAMSRDNYAHSVRERLEKAMGLLLCTAFAIVLITIVFADSAVPLLLGSRFTESSMALKILIWAIIPRYLNYSLNMSLLAGGFERFFIVTSLVCLAVNVIGNLVFIPIFSWRAAAGFTIVTELALLAQNVYWHRKAMGSVPKPFGWARASLIFSVLFVIIILGAKLVQPLALGVTCIVFFIGYLYFTGLLGEYASVWRIEQSAFSCALDES